MSPADWHLFHSNVDRTRECWTWMGAHNADGLPVFWPSYPCQPSRPSLATSLAWVDEHGGIPANHHLAHTCGHDWCLCPAHMYLDADAPSGHPYVHGNAGSRNARATVPVATVMRIKAMYRDGSENRDIAAALNLTVNYVARVTSGKLWPTIS